jgi:hypothetical protein
MTRKVKTPFFPMMTWIISRSDHRKKEHHEQQTKGPRHEKVELILVVLVLASFAHQCTENVAGRAMTKNRRLLDLL